jgi:nucleoid-associated protein YgaU
VVTPPAPAARPPAVPQVESFPEETYRCQPGDTFEAISRAKYNTPAYAQALLLFNRNHPLSGDGLQADPPVLQSGQPVYVPPAGILEKRYAHVIKNLTPLPTGEMAAPAAAAGAAANLPTYRVRGSGEWLREVARETLGNSERWQEIWQLNQALDYRAPVPPGTVLRLPAGARVPPSN